MVKYVVNSEYFKPYYSIGGDSLIFIILGALNDSERDLVNQIFREHNVKLFNISLKILRSHSDAEEAVSSTFLKIIDHIEKISKLPCPQIAPYCVVIVKHESTNILRRKKKIISFEDMDYLDNDDFVDAGEYLYKHWDKAQLCKVISQLSDEERYFISLRYSNEMGYKEIANLIGTSEETAKKRGQRILKKLRILYKVGEQNVQHI